MFWYIVSGVLIIIFGLLIFSDRYSDWAMNTVLFTFAIFGTVVVCVFCSLISSTIYEESHPNLDTYTISIVEKIPVYATDGLLVYRTANDTKDVSADSYIFADVEKPYLEKTIYSYESFFVVPWMSTVTKTVCYLPEKGI